MLIKEEGSDSSLNAQKMSLVKKVNTNMYYLIRNSYDKDAGNNLLDKLI